MHKSYHGIGAKWNVHQIRIPGQRGLGAHKGYIDFSVCDHLTQGSIIHFPDQNFLRVLLEKGFQKLSGPLPKLDGRKANGQLRCNSIRRFGEILQVVILYGY